jgi:hypothetical protein
MHWPFLVPAIDCFKATGAPYQTWCCPTLLELLPSAEGTPGGGATTSSVTACCWQDGMASAKIRGNAPAGEVDEDAEVPAPYSARQDAIVQWSIEDGAGGHRPAGFDPLSYVQRSRRSVTACESRKRRGTVRPGRAVRVQRRAPRVQATAAKKAAGRFSWNASPAV